MTAYLAGRPSSTHLPTPDAQSRRMSPCAKKCCWSPYGHSTVRDGLPEWHAERCKCHTEPKASE